MEMHDYIKKFCEPDISYDLINRSNYPMYTPELDMYSQISSQVSVLVTKRLGMSKRESFQR